MKYISFTLFFLVASVFLKAQTAINGAQGFLQPNIGNMSTYGNTPVGLYTGMPNISIPLHEFQLKDIRLPLNLNYHPYNVKPGNLPGEAGLGWNLECGGYITRTIKNQADKDYYDKKGDGLYPYRIIKTEGRMLSEASLAVQFPHIAPDSPDEFNFNFLGYSGSFIYNVEEDRWMIQSDSDIKIEYSRITHNQTRNQISEPTQRYYNHLNSSMGHDIEQSPSKEYLFDSFILTTPDGYKYIFGGIDKTDYNVTFKGFKNFPIPVTWHLSKIISAGGHEIEFKYKSMPLQINGNMSFNITVESLFRATAVSYDYELIIPMQLSEIIDNTDRKRLVSFSYAPSIQLPYDTQYAWLTASNDGLVTFFTKNKNFTLNQLNSLTILDQFDYKFFYTINTNERLKLNKISKIAKSGSTSTYYLNYYPQRLPGYNTGHYDNLGFYNGKNFSYYFSADFFLNARKKDQQVIEGMNYTKNRLGDTSGKYVTAEMLKSITYPTKGYTEFIYEPNSIFYMVSVNRKILHPARLPYPGTPDYTHPGGLRIKQINNYEYSGELLTRKHYYYTTDFSPENRNGQSSGILSFTPQYLWGFELYNLLYTSNANNEYIPYNALISQSSNPLWYNSRGEYIGYSKVTECNEDKNGKLIDGYTTHTFRNFEAGYMDEDPIVMVNHEYTGYHNGFPFTPTPYSPFTPCASKALKRGVITCKEMYNNEGQIKQKELFEYTPIQKDSMLVTEMTYTSIIDYNPDDPMLGEQRHAFGGTYYKRAYSNLLSEKQTYIYDDLGNTLSYKTKYRYDSNKLVKSQITEDGNGNVYEEKTKYLMDMLKYPNITPYNIFYLMHHLHFTSYPLEKIKIKNDKVIDAKTYFYKPANNQESIVKFKEFSLGKHVPVNSYQGLHAQGITLFADSSNIESITYLAYDSYNNPIHVRNEKDKSETVFLYGYKGKYAIAEIKNSDYQSVARILGNELINSLSNSSEPSYSDMQKVENLRTQLATSFITTYKYIPYVGMSQITDPRNITTYFEYDDLGRLIHKKDTNKHLINTYTYSNNL